MNASSSPSTVDVATVLPALRRTLGGVAVIDADTQDAVRYLHDWSGDYRGAALAVLRPATVAEVQAIVKLCGQHRLASYRREAIPVSSAAR